jgi:hypothetical protein
VPLTRRERLRRVALLGVVADLQFEHEGLEALMVERVCHTAAKRSRIAIASSHAVSADTGRTGRASNLVVDDLASTLRPAPDPPAPSSQRSRIPGR